MKLVVSVVDGFHGRPAGGVGVSVVSSAGNDTHTGESRGVTDENGEFRYKSGIESSAVAERFEIELDVDAYFSALGIVSFYRKVGASCRVFEPASDYRMVAVITPFMQATLSAH